MTNYLKSVVLITVLAGLTLAADVIAGNGSSPASRDGLKLIEKHWRSDFYARPETDWSTYTQIQLQDAPVTFRRDWQRNQNRAQPFKVTDKDMEKIKSSLSSQVREMLVTELSKSGSYKMAETSGPHVLLIKPAIVNLDVVAPDTIKGTFSRQYADSSTRMTLKLEIYDSVTGQLLATSSDRLEDPRLGYLEWTTRGSNRADSERLLRQWAAGLRQRLEKVRANRLTFADERKSKVID